MNRYRTKILCLPLLIMLTGCTPSASSGNRFTYEYISPEQQALEVVKDSPSQFLVPVSDEAYAWERVGFFFKDVLGTGLPKVSANTASGESFAEGDGKNYSYVIRKAPSREGVMYSVRCVDKATNAVTVKSDLNARNLSRFISEGKLEKKVLAL